MTVTATAIGSYTKKFTISGETSSTGLMTAVDTWLTTATTPDWTQYDSLNANGVYTYVYRRLCFDATMYKYLILRWNTNTLQLHTNTCESWNSGTHVATNEAWNYRNAYPVPYHLDGCDLYVFASKWYALFLSDIRSDLSTWCGVVEVEREAAEDTAGAGYPCWGWINSNTLISGYGTNGTTYVSLGNRVSLPRNKAEQTGVAASAYQAILTPSGMFPVSNQSGTLVSGNQLAEHLSFLNPWYQWDQEKKNIYPLRVITSVGYGGSTINHGRLMGLKAIPPIGNALTKATVPIDSNMYYDAAGSDTEHWVLPTQSKYASYMAALPIHPLALKMQTLQFPNNTVAYSAACNNLFWYLANGTTTLYKLDAVTQAITTVTLPGNGREVIYDGSRYVYVTTSVGVTQIDTRNSDTLASYAVSGGCSAVCVGGDGTLLAGNYTASTTPSWTQLALPGMTFTRTVTSGTTLAQAQYPSSICTDFNGNYYSTHPCGSTASDGKIYKIVASSGTITNATNSTIASTSAAGVMWDGTELVMMQIAATSNCPVQRYSTTPSYVGYETAAAMNATAGNSWLNRVAFLNQGGFIYVCAGAHVALVLPRGNTEFVNLQYNPLACLANGLNGSQTTGHYFLATDGVRVMSSNSTAPTGAVITSNHNGRYKNTYQLGELLVPV